MLCLASVPWAKMWHTPPWAHAALGAELQLMWETQGDPSPLPLQGVCRG